MKYYKHSDVIFIGYPYHFAEINRFIAMLAINLREWLKLEMRFGRQTRQKSNGKEKDQEIPEGIQSIPTQAHSGSVWYSNHFRIIGIFVPETKT